MAKAKVVKEEKVEETLPVEQPTEQVIEPVVEQPVETPQVSEPTPEVAVVRSEAYKAMESLIESYRRTSRPEKFARKLPELLAKLSKL
jgi:hypothetical protein